MSAKSLKQLLMTTLEDIKGNAAIARAEADSEPHEWYVSKEKLTSEIYNQLNAKNYLVQGRITAEMQEIVEKGVNNIYEEAWKKGKQLEARNAAFLVPQGPDKFSIVVIVAQKQEAWKTVAGKAVPYYKDSDSVFATVKAVYKKPLRDLRSNLNAYFKEVTGKTKIRARNKKAKKDKDGNIIQKGIAADPLLQLGHIEGESISDRRIAQAEQSISANSLSSAETSGDITQIINFLKSQGFTILFDKSSTKDATRIKVFMQAQSTNQGKQAALERKAVNDFKAKLEKAIKNLDTEYLGSEGSDSRIDIEKKKVLRRVSSKLKNNKKVIVKLENTKLNLKSSKAKYKTKTPKIRSKKVAPSAIALGLKGAKSVNSRASKSSTPSAQSYFSLIPIINEALPDVVRSNMEPPGLQNRSGRFAESVRVDEIVTTRKGFPSIGYTYKRNPYSVFEVGAGKTPWATDQRDPRKVIDKSIRQIVTGLIEERFYTRRI